jgi:hypothetical protein
MDRRAFLRAAGSAAAAGCRAAEAGAGIDEHAGGVRESARRIELATAAGMAMQRRDWEQGIFAQAMLESEQRERLIQVTRAAMVQQVPDGRMGVVVSGGPTDPAMGGAAYAQATEWTGEPAMRQAVDRMLDWTLIRRRGIRRACCITHLKRPRCGRTGSMEPRHFLRQWGISMKR